MAKRTWEINLDDKSYSVQITHGYWSGKREILVNGVLIAKGSDINAGGLSHTFMLGDQSCELQIATNGFVYRYILFVGDTPYLAKADSPKDKLIQAVINESVYWRNIARLTGLRYIAVPRARGLWKHRLVGAINGYVLAMRFVQLRQSHKFVIGTIIRYAPVLNPDDFKLRLNTDLVALFGKSLGNDQDLTDSHLWVAIPYDFKKESSDIMAQKILNLVNIVSKYTRPLREDTCDSKTCRQKVGAPLKVVFLNEYPALLWQDCIDAIPNWGRQAKDGYKRAPAGLLKGILAGVGVAALGSLVWAIFAVLFKSIASVLGAGIFIGVVKIMDKVGTKRTGISLLLAAVLAVCGVFLGVYLTFLWLAVSESAISIISLETILFELKVAWEMMWANPKLLNLSLTFGSFGVILYLVFWWIEQNGYFNRVFRPQVEVIDSKWF